MTKKAILCVLTILLGNQPLFSDPVDFNSDIRPILNQRCTSCHGGVKRKGGFSLIYREETLKPAKSGDIPIVPGDAAASAILRRISHEDEENRMPPEGDPLTKDQIATISQWIDEGAPYAEHWAYLAPVRHAAPAVKNVEWSRNHIDPFILHRLEKEGLAPSPEAESHTLLRRLYFDLTGLPPGLDAVKRFMADASDSAYEAVVDELLASPHYGERWASMWLDLARYADTQGYEKDSGRTIWPYRDWVIEAFNQDLSYREFTIDQLAGDLRENATEAQKVATGFHRNTMCNAEGGTDDEEFRVAAVIDRVNTTWEVWMGTSMGCVQCHSHPYDPFVHTDYFQFMDFLNSTADSDKNDDVPTLKVKNALMPVMQELPNPRPTHVFNGGNWLSHGDRVSRGTPAVLPAMDSAWPSNRLGMAYWMTAPRHPLTARVAVNRFWEQIFGHGIVSTVADFGTQGEAPSHPELLDDLAVRFVEEQGWSVKALLKSIVMSATYRQSSHVTPELLERDPQNQLLARGSRYRLSAEQIRDQALVASGLFNSTLFGPSVMPPQPDGIWAIVYSGQQWKTDTDGNRYRRGLYTYWRRTSPYPSMESFDAPSREFCVTRRIRTNTPLQALVSLNDPAFVEAARATAARMLTEGGQEVADRLRFGFMLALARAPETSELERLSELYRQEADYYSQHADHAAAFGKVTTNSAEFAAWTSVANVLLNLDETLTRE